MRNFPDLWRTFERRPLAAFGAMQPLFSDLDSLFGDALQQPEQERRAFLPACDIEETDSGYVISFDVPGMAAENIDIEVNGKELTVSGERRQERSEATDKLRKGRFSERRFGQFKRSFLLPDDVRTDEITAEFQHGVLTLVAPKTREAQRHKIKIGEADKLNLKSVDAEGDHEQPKVARAK